MSVSIGPGGCLRHRYSSTSLRISLLHVEFHPPLPYSSLASHQCSSQVEPGDFTSVLAEPPAHALRPVIPINARTLRITAAAGT